MIISIIDVPRSVSREANLRALTNARIEIIRYGRSNRLSIEYKEDYTRYIIQNRKDTGLKTVSLLRLG